MFNSKLKPVEFEFKEDIEKFMVYQDVFKNKRKELCDKFNQYDKILKCKKMNLDF